MKNESTIQYEPTMNIFGGCNFKTNARVCAKPFFMLTKNSPKTRTSDPTILRHHTKIIIVRRIKTFNFVKYHSYNLLSLYPNLGQYVQFWIICT